MSLLFDCACMYAERGWSVIPVRYQGKTPIIPWQPFQQARPQTDQLQKWFLNDGRRKNLGIVTGAISNLVVLDIDEPEVRKYILLHFGEHRGPIVRTHAGEHWYFYYDPKRDGEIRNRKGAGFDLRGEGGMVVAPPSIHESGTEYGWMRNEHHIVCAANALMPAIPDWLLQIFAPKETA